MLLITGGAGYIGSHCAAEFIKNNYDIVIIDNLSTGHIEIIKALKKINPDIRFEKGDLNNISDIEDIFNKYEIDGVIHFAAYSQVSESTKNPVKYYQNNVSGTINLIKTMIKNNVLRMIFSSSASVYGESKYIPIDENHPKNPINPYGKTKLVVENILDDCDRAYNLKSIKLRYFNVVGANYLINIGEWHDIETHLLPNILKSTFKKEKGFKIFGDNYDTKDGSAIRDYVDVEDLAAAHILAYEYLKKENKTDAFNIGTKEGTSIKEIFEYTKKVLNTEIPYEITSKREREPAILCADYTKAKNILNWMPSKTIIESIKNAYCWEKHLQNILNTTKSLIS